MTIHRRISRFVLVSAVLMSGLLLLSATQEARAQALPAPESPPAGLQPPTTPYGPPIDLKTALEVLEAAQLKAEDEKWPVAIAVVDNAGFLVAFHRLDNTQLGSVETAIEKAKTATLFRRPTKAFEDVIAQGGAGLRILKLPGATPLDGGVPIIREGKIIGAVGVSGVQSSQDGQVAAAGASVVK